MAAIENVSLSFKEGRWFDFWTLPHVMTGVLGGFSNAYFGLSIPAVLAIGFVLMVAWEGFELAVGIRESWPNRILDIVVGLVGVVIALVITPSLGHWGRVAAFAISFAIGATSGTLGWLASRRKKRAVPKSVKAG